MARYIEETAIYKLVEPHGTAKVHCSQIDELPRADVVPKSEVESIITLNSQLEAKVFEQRKEVERLTVELDVMRGAANSYKMHYEKAMEVQKEVYRLASEIKAELPSAKAELAKNVAREIFAEIDNILYKFSYPSLTAIGKINVIQAEGYHLRTRDYAELKKKYTEGEDKDATDKKHFSPEDVRNMTPQEVREKYTAIRKSMEMW